MTAITCNKLTPIQDGILVTGMNFAEQKTASGIIINSDNGKSEGIKPRWAKVYAVGKIQTDVNVGDWILVEHGRWTRGITIKTPDGEEIEVRRVENKSIMMISDECPTDAYLGQSNQQTTQTFDFSQPMY
jgi:co-chaperonin GroES (HSP10)